MFSLFLAQHFKKLFGRSLQLRQVSAAGCNACEADLNVLATPFFDLARFGINFVASPRHADGIVVTGPISRNMKTALLQTYEATPEPRVVIAGVPTRSPEVIKGERGSLGTAFLLTVMFARPRAASAATPRSLPWAM